MPNFKDTFAAKFADKFTDKFASTNVNSAPQYMHLQGWHPHGLSSSYDDWVKYKEKVPDVSDPNQNAKTTCNSKLKFR